MRPNKIKPLNPAELSLEEDRSLYSEDGVDLTLIRWMLSMTPGERPQVLQQTIRSILRLRGDISDT